MKVSVFTPTHNPKYLDEVYESLKDQTYSNREWIILPNNGAKIDQSTYLSDERVRVYHLPGNTTNIGYWKKQACELALGDILLELDHDDLLTPDCLEEVVSAFESDNEIGFVYSENAKLGPFTPYDPYYGREAPYMIDWKGEQLPVMRNLPLHPHNMGYIYFMPDHVRAWRKTVYDSIGGHNQDLEVCDDQELIMRTYLVTKFHEIKKCLYIYRITGENTSINSKNALVQKKTLELYDQYIYQVAERRADLNNLSKIDLCGGFSKPEGYTSIDLQGGDISADLNKKRPLGDGKVGVIRAHDALEHLVDKQHTMKEIYRVLAKGGILLSRTPSTDGRGAFQDPTHVAFWNENSFRYWIKGRNQPQYIHNTEHLFGESRLVTYYPGEWYEQNKICYVQANLYKPL